MAKIKEFGPINTFTVTTPSGGTHYYFKLSSTNEDVNFIIKHYLYTRAGVGGFSIDTRNENGYIVAPPSLINGKAYSIANPSTINEMPIKLANFLKEIDEEKG